MARAMGKAGVSITITSFTDAIAFILGTTSQLPALSAFCGFAAIGIAADFLLQARTVAPLTMALLTMAPLTMALLTMALLTRATHYGGSYACTRTVDGLRCAYP